MGEKITLKIDERSVHGKKVKNLRKEGLTPGVVYGHGMEPLAVQADAGEVRRVVAAAGRHTPVNLTGAQITVDVREKGGYITDTFGAAIIDAADGRVYLSLPEDPEFLQAAGNYEAEITVKFPNDAQQTVYDLLPMKVRERFSKGA